MELYIKTLKEKIEEMVKYEKLADEAEARMIANPADAKAEYEFDVYYSKQYNNWSEAIQILKILTKCDDNTAKRMIATKKDDIEKLLKFI